MSINLQKTNLSFTASTDSAAISSSLILGIQTPASFTATSLVLLYCATADGTFIPVCNETGAAIGVTGISGSAAQFYDLTNIFPLGIEKINNVIAGYIKFRANTSITNTITVYTLAGC